MENKGTGAKEGLIQAGGKLSPERKPGELLTPMKAIRSKCLDCCCDSAKEIALCPMSYCPCWPYRFGTRTRARKIVAEERSKKGLSERYWAEELDDYTSQKYYRSEQAAREREGGA